MAPHYFSSPKKVMKTWAGPLRFGKGLFENHQVKSVSMRCEASRQAMHECQNSIKDQTLRVQQSQSNYRPRKSKTATNVACSSEGSVDVAVYNLQLFCALWHNHIFEAEGQGVKSTRGRLEAAEGWCKPAEIGVRGWNKWYLCGWGPFDVFSSRFGGLRLVFRVPTGQMGLALP